MIKVLRHKAEHIKTRIKPEFFLDVANALEQQPCKNCINRSETIKYLNTNMAWYDEDGEIADSDEKLKAITDLINGVPSAQPKTGHWRKTPKAVMGEGYMWYCDKCEHQVYQDSSRPYPSERYCPNCGARMIEPQESENVERHPLVEQCGSEYILHLPQESEG